MRPVLTVQLVAVAPEAVQEPPAGDEVTVYMVIAVPPFDAGSVQLTVAFGGLTKAMPPTLVAVPMVGVPGTVAGTAAGEAADAGPMPEPLVAVTVKVYDVPLVRPDTVQLVVLELQNNPPGDDVAV